MMRAIDQDTGFRTYTERLVDTLLRIDGTNSYLLLYRTRRWLGRFADCNNAAELLIGPSHKLLWDQFAVPYWALKKRADIIFNPKFSVPLLSHCPTAMGLQEPSWWAHPEHHSWLEVAYMRTMLPLYCRKSSHFFPWTRFILEENRKYLKLPLESATVTYAAPNFQFRRPRDQTALAEFRDKYKLPKQFILNVSRVENIGLKGTAFTGTKNVETAIQAFRLCRDRVPHRLVIAGHRIHEYLENRGWTDADLEGVQFLGLVPHLEMPKLYEMADLFILPSFYEGFAFTLVEAMSCGCPVVASRTGACLETTGGAGLLADPEDSASFADKILCVLGDVELREELRRKGLERSSNFNWERTARAVLEGLTRAVEQARRRPG